MFVFNRNPNVGREPIDKFKETCFRERMHVKVELISGNERLTLATIDAPSSGVTVRMSTLSKCASR